MLHLTTCLLLNGPQTVNILSIVGHRIPVAPHNFLLLSVSAKDWKFSYLYSFVFACRACEVHGGECENLSSGSHISLGSTSQHPVEQPKWIPDARSAHKDALSPCCPAVSASGGTWAARLGGLAEELHGQAGLWQ